MGVELKLPNPQLAFSDPIRVTPIPTPKRSFRTRILAPRRPNSESEAALVSGAAAIGRRSAIAGRGRAARGVGSRRRDWNGGAELSPLLLLRARRRGRGCWWQERSGAAAGAALVGLHGLQQLSPMSPRRALTERFVCRRGEDLGCFATAPGAGGCWLDTATEEVVVRGCWLLLGWAWCWCCGRSPFRLGLDVVVLVLSDSPPLASSSLAGCSLLSWIFFSLSIWFCYL